MSRGRPRGKTQAEREENRLIAQAEERTRRERERVLEAEQHLRDIMAEVPEPHQTFLRQAILAVALNCFNDMQMEKGDGLLVLLRTDVADRFVNWYFDDREPTTMPGDLLADP